LGWLTLDCIVLGGVGDDVDLRWIMGAGVAPLPFVVTWCGVGVGVAFGCPTVLFLEEDGKLFEVFGFAMVPLLM